MCDWQRRAQLLNCVKCLEYNKLCLEYAASNSFRDQAMLAKYIRLDTDHSIYEPEEKIYPDLPSGLVHQKAPKERISHHEGNGKPKGLFAFTLTFSPKDGLNEYDLKHAAEKIMNQQTCKVKRYIYYLETKEDGTHPHIHGVYETEDGGRIHNKYFQRYWKVWDPKIKLGSGFKGGYHEPVASAISYKEYIEKDEGYHCMKGEW